MDGDSLLTGHVIDSSITVHSTLGPGLLESAYVACLAYELQASGLDVLTEVPFPVVYRGVSIELGYRLDLLINDALVVEVKAVTKVLPVHHAQLLSYLRLSHRRVGLLINFHVPRLREGITRMVNKA